MKKGYVRVMLGLWKSYGFCYEKGLGLFMFRVMVQGYVRVTAKGYGQGL